MGRSSLLVANVVPWGRVSGPAGLAPEAPQERECSCRGVNTKNWYREETDLWAEFGRRAPFKRKFSSKHSVKTSAVGSTPSFGRRVVSHLEERAFGNT
jgi:hypothetical protein